VPALRTEHARINADFGNDNFGDDSVPVRVSDHDPVVLYLPVAEFGSADLDVLVGGTSEVTAGKPLQFTSLVQNLGPGTGRDVQVRLQVNFELPGVSVQAPAGFTCAAPVVGGGQSVVECVAATLARGGYAFTLDAPTATAMVDNTLTFQVRAQSVTDDPRSDNNLGFTSTFLSPPVSDLVVQVLDAPFILKGKDVLRIRLSNLGRDPARNVRVSFQASNGGTKLAPVAPAGWTCGSVALLAGSYRTECELAGDFAEGRQQEFELRLASGHSNLVVLTAGASTSTYDFNAFNNFDSRVYMVLVRRTK
jgi:hypothetical protein